MASEGAARNPPPPARPAGSRRRLLLRSLGCWALGRVTRRGVWHRKQQNAKTTQQAVPCMAAAPRERVLGVVGACPVLPGPLSPWDTPKPVLPPAPSSSLAGRVGQRLRGAGAGSGSCCSPEEVKGSKWPRGRQPERWRGQDWLARPCGGGVPVLVTPALGARASSSPRRAAGQALHPRLPSASGELPAPLNLCPPTEQDQPQNHPGCSPWHPLGGGVPGTPLRCQPGAGG